MSILSPRPMTFIMNLIEYSLIRQNLTIFLIASSTNHNLFLVQLWSLKQAVAGSGRGDRITTSWHFNKWSHLRPTLCVSDSHRKVSAKEGKLNYKHLKQRKLHLHGTRVSWKIIVILIIIIFLCQKRKKLHI